MSTEEIYVKLKSDREFIQRIAEVVLETVVVKKLDEFERQSRFINDNLVLIWEKLAENDIKFNKIHEELVKLRQEMNDMRKDFNSEIIKLRQEMNDMRKDFNSEIIKLRQEMNDMRKDFNSEIIKLRQEMNDNYKQIARFVENLTTSIEDDAQYYLQWLIEKKLGYKAEITRLEIDNVVEIDIFSQFGNYLLIGEVKSRANKSVYMELMRKVEKLKTVKPELFKDKKVILVIFSLSVTKDLLDLCKENKVYLTTGSRDLTKLEEII
ncbi:DNA repair ATPase [Sulfolobus acidocaldarius]|uniref:DNA repair ATPase n=1 Tax=Sulfolobus acidocaldarius (strain ATCC 33909 / DSM 639 / JCM 8929 / NBRC 15157 / NCIMB 11770) TaxID=330779 RepID=Q4J718_SULAC|nr:DNA repair ATPase [Sulfolobus acidocaldarius]AAY81428.1 DNA repair ATPase [Sulfolobus acidocaldarius DSM 639]